MRISKKQLGRIIKEAGKWDDYDEYGNPKGGPKLYGPDAAAAGIGVAAQQMVDKGKKGKPAVHPDYEGLPQSDIDYYELADDYAMWVKENGHIKPADSSAMATYFLEKGLEDDHEKHEMLGKAFQVSHADIMKELKLQAADQKAAEEILSTRMGDYSSSPYRKKTNEGVKMKITKRQLKRIIKEERVKLVLEANPDGTISDDEEEREADLMASVEIKIDELIEMATAEAYAIGGTFRGPGIRSRVKKLIFDKLSMMRG